MKSNLHLEKAIVAWRLRSGQEAPLSDAARARVLDAALRENGRVGSPEALVPLFSPGWRWVWAGALPAVVLTIALGILAFPFDTGSRTPAPTRVVAMKNSGEVVFLISNGGVEHRVSKCTLPTGSSGGTAVRTRNGAFRDTLESEETIVFYRID